MLLKEAWKEFRYIMLSKRLKLIPVIKRFKKLRMRLDAYKEVIEVIDISTWMNEFLYTLTVNFGERVWFVGLQGS